MSNEIDREDLDAWEVDDLGDGFDDRVLAAWDEQAAPSRSHRGFWIAAAAVLLAVGLTWVWATTRPSSTTDAPQNTMVTMVTVTAAADARVDFDRAAGVALQDAGKVSYRVPHGMPLRVQTPAADVIVGGTEFTVEVLSMNDERRKKWWGAGALAMGGAAVAVYVQSGTVEVRNAHGTETVSKGQVVAASEHSAPHDPSDDAGKPKVAARAKSKARKISAAEREEVRRKLQTALKRRAPSQGATKSEAPAKPADGQEEEPLPGNLDKDYIKEVIAEDLLPIAVECYSSALSDNPKLGGKLMLEFAIVGDESVGGIVEEVALGEDSTLIHPDLEECMVESTASLLFDPPEGGGRVTVTYPFVFEPDDGSEAPPPAE